MSEQKVTVHELIAWELDEYPFRNAMADFNPEEMDNKITRAHEILTQRRHYVDSVALLASETNSIQHLLAAAAQREDLIREHEGLNWMVGVVDLRCLLAFQRRLVFSPARRAPVPPDPEDWPRLVSLTLGDPRSTGHWIVRNDCVTDGLDISLYSSNPDLQLRLTARTGEGGPYPFSLHGGSPFFEVAELRGRWFLRDGYHRAYHLLRAGVHRVPAVVIFSRTMEELGATEPWFFSEEQLFSDGPPQLIDFLDESLVLHYERAALRKVIRVRIEESLEPFDEIAGIQGDIR